MHADGGGESVGADGGQREGDAEGGDGKFGGEVGTGVQNGEKEGGEEEGGERVFEPGGEAREQVAAEEDFLVGGLEGDGGEGDEGKGRPPGEGDFAGVLGELGDAAGGEGGAGEPEEGIDGGRLEGEGDAEGAVVFEDIVDWFVVEEADGEEEGKEWEGVLGKDAEGQEEDVLLVWREGIGGGAKAGGHEGDEDYEAEDEGAEPEEEGEGEAPEAAFFVGPEGGPSPGHEWGTFRCTALKLDCSIAIVQ